MNKIKYIFEKIRLKRFPRFKRVKSGIFKFPITIADKSSFIFMYKEIFIKEIYKFNSTNESPNILDCGANIGLSTIYFKYLYPKAKITSFEPDKDIFNILKENIDSSNFQDITLINKGLGKDSGVVSFFSEGADGGRIALETDKDKLTQVEITKLSPYMNETIDFLKIDIEGSELEVLEECKHLLQNVENIFIEYHSIFEKPQALDRILSILTESGFRYYIEQVGVTSKNPFIKFENYLGYDLQLNISAKRNIL